MDFKLDGNVSFLVEEEALPGVKRVAGYVVEDFSKVFSKKPSIVTQTLTSSTIFVATIGSSPLLDSLTKTLKVDTSVINNLREVYMITVIDGALAVIGSDKRGTIYGLFKLSEMIGVSPFVNWCDVPPMRKESVLLSQKDMIVSKEPSVKYRGFFINDEWPAFGNWSLKRFGGVNAKCYEKIFELLLRLKGNYMWPAMWASRFNMDGPDLQNAILADEMGVVMGMSHHEPCNRSGEEYKYVRGPQSIYGDDWNFVRNRDGITKFWEDGLKRCAPFETVITVGMRGEADSTILGREATLADNIEYLRDVLVTQERLIKECVNENIMEVPRMLALYKEVEPFFYGDENTKGLMDSKELEGVTLMLCDDNFGNLRTIPTEHMKSHKGGYGMYYHFDYHGSPVSYEWVNSSYIPKVHQQMCTAYDNGIRDLWIVNVGDIFTTEFPLGFFLDLAYDYDKWGSSNPNAADEYTENFVDTNFPTFSPVEKDTTIELLDRYTYLAHNRRPETLNPESILKNMRKDDLDELYRECLSLSYNTKMMYEGVSAANKFPFYEFVYYPAMGNLNTHILNLESAYSHFLASIGALKANEMNGTIMDCIEFDRELVEEINEIHDGFWYGMGMSEHIGFKNWNEEECHLPNLVQVLPTNKARIVAVVPGNLTATEGGDWTKKTLKVYTDSQGVVELFATSYKDTKFDVKCDSEFILLDSKEGVIKNGDVFALTFKIDESKRKSEEVGEFVVNFEYGHIKVCVLPMALKDEFTVDLVEGEDITYKFNAPFDGKYAFDVVMMPTNPPFMDNKLLYELKVNENTPAVINAVSDSFKVGDNQIEWYIGVMNNQRVSSSEWELKKGANTFSVKAKSIGMCLKKVIIRKV